jgi:GT2 family glycosyltransferase/glycosyltransferase involved in cell wall biosynthesis
MSKIALTPVSDGAKGSAAPAGAMVGDIHLARGKIFVQASPEILSMDPRLDCAGEIRPLAPVAAGPFDFPDGMQTLLQMLPVTTPDYVLSINLLQDWFIDGTTTAQIKISSPEQPIQIPVSAPLQVPSIGQPGVFEANLGCHRGVGDLCLSVRDVDSGKETILSVPFDQSFFGGKTEAGYQKVTLELPLFTGESILSLQIAYRAVVQDGSEPPPFFFVGQPRVTTGRNNLTLTPISILGPKVRDGVWLEADLPGPRFSSGDITQVVFGTTKIPVFTGLSHEIYCDNNFGHYLDLRASKPGNFVLWINGKPAMPLELGPHAIGVRIPTSYLVGDHALLQLFDPSGTQLFWSDWSFLRRILTPNEVLLRESQKPYPTELFAQSRDRNRAVRSHLAAGSPPEILSQLEQVLDTLEAGHEYVKLRPLAFPDVAEPMVSIIIPAHNKVNVTYACLSALLLAHNKASFEVILVDDASTDETTMIEKLVSGIKVVRNVEPQRFIRACNAGAAVARGTYVALLNNDTEPTVGWLDELIAAFGRFDNVGLAGSKLLYPDGKLQDGGGIVWGSGNPWNYGVGQNPWEPRFCYARQADYLSGASMLTTREIWNELGGLSSYLEPMYFEDTDFAFKVRNAGYSTWFVPSSIVYHFEGLTSGTDTSSGFKRYQAVNGPAFKRRWAKAFAEGGKEGVAPDLAKDRNIVGRVLFIDYTTPMPDRDAGSYAALQEIRLVQSLGYKVTFVPENLAHMASRTNDLEKMGVEMIVSPFFHSIDEFLRDRGSEFDVIYITRYHVVNNVVQTIRETAPRARIIMNNADLHFLRTLRTALATNDPVTLARVPDIRRQELEAMHKVDLVLSYNEVEHSVIQSHTDVALKVMKCPWVVECPETVPARELRTGMSFLGSFNHHPNLEGIEWFAKEVMPLFETGRSAVPLAIYGSGMGDRVKKLKSEFVDPLGFVEDAADAYDRHLVFVAPLLSGAGIKGKVLMALARGTPCVLSPMAAEGIGLRDGFDCIIAEKPADWHRAVMALIDDADFWASVSKNGRALAKSQFSFGRAREQMRQAFEAVDLFGSLA